MNATSAEESCGRSVRGRLIVVSAPSGAGKTSLVRALLDNDPNTRFSTSYTTRPPRRGEQDGRDYFFVTEPEFSEMVAAGSFWNMPACSTTFTGPAGPRSKN